MAAARVAILHVIMRGERWRPRGSPLHAGFAQGWWL